MSDPRILLPVSSTDLAHSAPAKRAPTKPSPLALPKARVRSNAPQVGCSDDCETCFSQWRGPTQDYRFFNTDAQARQLVKKMRDETTRDLNHARDLLDTHGDHILDRWRKMSRNERKSILKDVQPSIFEDHGFPVAAYLKGPMSENPIAGSRLLRRTFLSPFITLENLAEDSTNLPLLLRHRTESPPSDWAAFDSEQHTTHFLCDTIDAYHNSQCMVVAADGYGELVPWNATDAHSLKILSFPRAQLVLAAQMEIARVLGRTCDAILRLKPTPHGVCLGRTEIDALAGSRAVSTENLRDPAFSQPPMYDLEHIIDLVRSRRDLAEDELRPLQSSPDALRQSLAVLQRVSTSTYGTKDDKARHAVGLAMLTLQRADMWKYLSIEAEASYLVLKQPLSNGDRSSREHDDALSTLSHVLKQQIRLARTQLSTSLASVPAFVRTFKKLQNQEELSTDETDLYFRDELLFHLTAIAHHEGQKAEPLAWHFRELHRLPEEQLNRIDQRSCDLVSDLMALQEALDGVSARRPRGRPFAEVMGIRVNKSTGPLAMSKHARDFDNRFRRWSFLCMHHVACPEGLLTLKQPLSVYLNLPNSKGGVSKTELKRVEDSHAALDVFWSKARAWRAECLRVMRLNAGTVLEHLKCISVSLTQQHKDSMEAERKALTLAIEAQEAANTSSLKERHPNTAPQHLAQAWGEDLTLRRDGTKHKTRPEATLVAPVEVFDDNAAALEQLQLNAPPQIEVKKASLEVFERLFDPSAQNRSSIKWLEFVAAMVDAGFVASSNGGAAVSFQDTNGKGTITFHRPHPLPVLVPVQRKNVAYRLNNRFGWTVESFVERTKEV